MLIRNFGKTFLWVLMLITLSCVDYDHLILPYDEPTLVVDAQLSDRKDFSSITIGWSFPVNTDCGSIYVPFEYSTNCLADTTASDAEVTGHVSVTEQGGFQYRYKFKMKERKGYFNLRLDENMIGTPGKKYVLDIDVTYKGKTETYHAETVMLETPVITSIDYEIRKGEIGKSNDFVPLISFREPPGERNYYLFKLCGFPRKESPSRVCESSSRAWNHSVLSDTFLPTEIVNLSVDNGATVVKYYDFYPDVNPGLQVEVHMFSVDEITFEFHKSLLSQFDNDGGAYSPSPSSPPGNISNGAIGLFRATQLSYARILY